LRQVFRSGTTVAGRIPSFVIDPRLPTSREERRSHACQAEILGELGSAMTEAKWLALRDLRYLLDFFEEKASRRKLRLFAAGCVRSILHLIHDHNCRTGLDVAEEYADGRTTVEMLKKHYDASEKAMSAAWRAVRPDDHTGGVFHIPTKQDALAIDLPGLDSAITKVEFDEVTTRDAIDAISGVLAHLAIHPDQWGTSAGDDAAMRALEAQRPKQLLLFRDVFGNPFRPTSIEPLWQKWNGSTIPRVAQHIYDDRHFQDLPVLADALEEAGCTNADILDHCRGPGPHIRGCWVVDLILGKS
jgi:hypothetical protein